MVFVGPNCKEIFEFVREWDTSFEGISNVSSNNLKEELRKLYGLVFEGILGVLKGEVFEIVEDLGSRLEVSEMEWPLIELNSFVYCIILLVREADKLITEQNQE